MAGPKGRKGPEPDTGSLPAPVARSEEHAQRTFAETRASAEETYDGDEGRAARVAYGALKHTYEKVGDHWERKDGRGPSDAQSARRDPGKVDHPSETAGGVDARASKAHLLDLARRLDVRGRSSMTKDELVHALDRANREATAKAR